MSVTFALKLVIWKKIIFFASFLSNSKLRFFKLGATVFNLQISAYWHLLRFYTDWKVSKYGVISGPYFPVFALNTEICFVNFRIQSEYRKIRNRKVSVFGHISRSFSFRYSFFLEIFSLKFKFLLKRLSGLRKHWEIFVRYH